MQPERERELAGRLLAAHASGGGELSGEPYVQPIRHYTGSQRLADEISRLLRNRPLAVALSGDLAQPGSYLSLDLAGIPGVLVRDQQGVARAFVNLCRHRGAPVASGSGKAIAGLVCPYHGWVYGLDGSLAACSRPEAFAHQAPGELALHPLPTSEAHGILWVAADAAATAAIDLGGAEMELASFQLERYVPFASLSSERAINWKLVIDTFLEAYHVPHLHRRSLAPYFAGDVALFDAFGAGGRLAVARSSLADLVGQPRQQWEVLPHTTLLYLLFPCTVLIHQQDHVELVRALPVPGHSDRARIQLSLYTPEAVARESEQRHWQKNWQVLCSVTEEDFELAERMQAGYAARPDGDLLFGSNESGLSHFHGSIERALGA